MGKFTGILLGSISTLFFLSLGSGQFIQPVFGLIPAIAFGATSIVLLVRGNRRPVPRLSEETTARLERLEDALAGMQVELDNANMSLGRLRDERAFLERLLVERNTPAPSKP